MLDRQELGRIALRHDTLMSWALRRALGISQRPRPGRRARAAAGPGRYEGMDECFRNERAPSILLRG